MVLCKVVNIRSFRNLKAPIFVLGLILSSVSFAGKSNDKSFNWVPFEQAFKKAAEEKKYIFIDFFADWCSFCHLLDNTSFRDPKVIQEIQNNFVPIRVDVESKVPIMWQGKTMTTSDFGQKMGVTGLPSMAFLNHKEIMVGSYPAYADAELLYKLLTYISSGARERQESFEEFVNNKK